MSVYALTPLAQADIFKIWSYIAKDNEDAADRVERAIYDSFEFIAEAPLRGHARPGLTARSLRFWTLTRYPNYTVVYRAEPDPLQVVAVLHGEKKYTAHSEPAPMRPPADRCFFSVIRLASGGYETSGYLAASLII